MPTIKLKIKDCRECPKFHSEKVYTADSWEDVEKWVCKAKHNKIITRYHEGNGKAPDVPEWCPLR